jgi:hypothetical protein
MSKIDMSNVKLARGEAPTSAVLRGQGQAAAPAHTEPSEEDRSKDAFFVQVAEMAEAMIARHGKEFAIGALVLAAKFLAEGRPLVNRGIGNGEAADAAKSG